MILFIWSLIWVARFCNIQGSSLENLVLESWIYYGVSNLLSTTGAQASNERKSHDHTITLTFVLNSARSLFYFHMLLIFFRILLENLWTWHWSERLVWKFEILALREAEGTNQIKWIMMIGFASLAKELEQGWCYRQAVFLIHLLADV